MSMLRTAVVGVTALAAAVGLSLPTAGGVASTRVRTQEPGVTANLWEWNWRSVGRECTEVLGPAGYDGVQVAPPQDSVKRTELGNGQDEILHPWWEVYQVVDYRLTSRMGSEAEFKTMVRTCRRAGVKVYVDAVINHTTGQGRTSYGGVDYTPYHYPGLYGPRDFHVPRNECPSSDGGIQDFNNVQQVFRCNLVGLEDLDTDAPRVQRRLAAYLNKLLRYGVSGFRVDAGKHIGQRDLDAIRARLHRTRDGVRPYWALEVFGGSPGVLSPQAFTRSGDVLGLDAAKQIQAAFKSYDGSGNTGSLAALEVFGRDSGLTSGRDTLSFVTNHDTDRNAAEYLGHKDGATFLLATMWLLAEGYGSPQVYSSFEWKIPDDSPPSDAGGLITDADCDAGWTCDHRDAGVLAMVRWHQYVGSARRADFWTDGANVIAFRKGTRGWVALNNGTAAKTVSVPTGMAAGSYCDTVHDPDGAGCSGATIQVDADGAATVTVPAKDAVAFTRLDRIAG